MTKSIYQGHVIKLYEEQFDLPNGKIVERAIIRHPGAVIIVPQNDQGELLLVRQYRYSVGQVLLEFPAGTLEPGESIEECAKREVVEEVGFSADEWHSLGLLHPAPGFCDEVQHCFFAKQLKKANLKPDEDEIMETVCMSKSRIEQAIAQGEMTDAKSIAIFGKLCFAGWLN